MKFIETIESLGVDITLRYVDKDHFGVEIYIPWQIGHYRSIVDDRDQMLYELYWANK